MEVDPAINEPAGLGIMAFGGSPILPEKLQLVASEQAAEAGKPGMITGYASTRKIQNQKSPHQCGAGDEGSRGRQGPRRTICLKECWTMPANLRVHEGHLRSARFLATMTPLPSPPPPPSTSRKGCARR